MAAAVGLAGSVAVVAAIDDVSVLTSELGAATARSWRSLANLQLIRSCETRLARHRGYRDATHDVEAHDLRIKTYGIPMPCAESSYAAVVKEYGVSLDWVAFCEVDEPTREYARAYDEVSAQAIEQRHGAGSFRRIQIAFHEGCIGTHEADRGSSQNQDATP